MRFSDLARGFTDYLVNRCGSSRGTRTTYDTGFDQFAGYLVSRGLPNDVREFTAENVDGFAAFLAEKGIAPNTIRRQLSALSALAKYAMKVKGPRGGSYVLDANPVDRVVRPKFAPPREKWRTLDEVRALFTVEAAPHERLALACVVDQPLRASEWCSLNVEDLTLVGDQVAIEVKVKGGGRRKKVLGARLGAQLEAYVRQREKPRGDAPLLLNGQGRRFTRQGFSEAINRIARRAGLRGDVRAHAMRHAIASAAAQTGATEFEIAEMLNHSGLSTVRRYTHGVRPDAALDKVREAVWK